MSNVIDVEKYRTLINKSYIKRLGKVVKIVGLTIESVGPDAKLNYICTIISNDDPNQFILA